MSQLREEQVKIIDEGQNNVRFYKVFSLLLHNRIKDACQDQPMSPIEKEYITNYKSLV
jgi:hypothetical protein